ncbi:MAG: UDP-N-acetylmuramoyl-L-alanine--D-glutamate ligase [Halioglobus sp.]
MTQDLIASSANRVVLGLGPTGLSVARYLHARGETFAVADTRQSPPCLKTLQEEMPDVPVFAGNIPSQVLETAGELIVSPGIALDDPVVAIASGAGVPVAGDIDLFAAAATAPIIGITGSNAKSTVTALLGDMAARAGLQCGVGGNLGTPALELLDSQTELYIIELSSFQLERAGALNLEVATVLNLTADHLDRHGSMPRYHQIKHRVFRGANKAVLNLDDTLTIPLVDESVELISWRLREPALNGFGLRTIDGVEYLCHGFEPVLASSALGLSGRHNIANALAALALGFAAGLPFSAMRLSLENFHGLPHRCERVAELDGVVYVNDSKGTNVGATDAAIRGLGQDHNVILIAGGQGKGAEFASLAGSVSAHCKHVVLLGEAAPQLRLALQDSSPVTVVDSMEAAVLAAAEVASSGDTVLLSPACASFDMFSGYAQRGEAFCAAVAALAEAGSDSAKGRDA